MVHFTQEQAEHLLCLIDAGNFRQVNILLSPVLITDLNIISVMSE